MAKAQDDGHEAFKQRLSEQLARVHALLDEIEKRRAAAESEGRSFTAPTSEQLEQKLRRSRSPFIYFQGWNNASAGGTVNYDVGITNPDPTPWIWLFVHLFVGPANIAPRVGDAVQAVDARFPRLVQPRFAGLTLNPGASQPLNFSIAVPSSVEPGNYLGNSILFQSVWHDPGTYLDRSVFVFEVT
jgi:hypothetical protein